LIEEGSGINPFYFPFVGTYGNKVELLSLWSGVMIPIYGFGEEIASLAVVEFSFKKCKTLTFKNITLLTSVDIFLENI